MARVNLQVSRQDPVPYLQPHGFTCQNKPKNIQNGPEMKEIYCKGNCGWT